MGERTSTPKVVSATRHASRPKSRAKSKSQTQVDGECTLPGTVSLEAIQQGTLHAPDHQKKEIAEYVEWQSNKGTSAPINVIHLEVVKSEVIFGKEHVAWDVHTDEPGRWWVITNPTNLYSQTAFPSLDYTFSFHIGIAARLASTAAKSAPDSHRDRLLSSWRRWENATEALDSAKEPEDFQSVAMKCRETLIDLVKSLQHGLPMPIGEEPPKLADFVGWYNLIATHYAGGKRNERIRGYLKANATEVWQLVNWLTHSSKAVLHEAHLVLDATANLLMFTSVVVMRAEADPPSICPNCKSYRVVAVFDSDLDPEHPYVNLCESCGWNDYDGDERK
jgi:hypothetical protein